MRKIFLSLVVALVGTMSSMAQTSLLATLSHNGEISTFYGANALREAHAAAANGDVVTLSSGTFNSVDITKGITLRGAGMTVDAVTQTEPTVIAGDYAINISTDIEESLTIEGVNCNGSAYFDNVVNKPVFIKSYFKRLQSRAGKFVNATFLHCKVYSCYEVGDCTASFVNSILLSLDFMKSCSFTNCVLSAGRWSYFDNSSFKNCVMTGVNSSAYTYFPSTATVYYCVAIGTYSSNLFNNLTNTTNHAISGDGSDFFLTYTGTYTDNETFELTEEAQAQYLGLDGTQVGIYGGNMPFDATPTNPQITKCNVASKSTADGKLSVDIEVRAAE